MKHATSTRTRRYRIAGAAAAACALAVVVSATPAAAAAASTITEHLRFVDVNPDSQNPCTGDLGTVIDVNDMHFHVTTLANGTINETGHNSADVTFQPSDSSKATYSGHETFAQSDSTRTTTGMMNTTSTFHLNMRGTDGNVIAIREVAHFTITPAGITSSAFDKAVLTCSHN